MFVVVGSFDSFDSFDSGFTEELIEELHNADNPSDIENILDDLNDIGWDYIYSALDANETTKKRLKDLVSNKCIILETN